MSKLLFSKLLFDRSSWSGCTGAGSRAADVKRGAPGGVALCRNAGRSPQGGSGKLGSIRSAFLRWERLPYDP